MMSDAEISNKEIKEQFIAACKSFGTLENHVTMMNCLGKHGSVELLKRGNIISLKSPEKFPQSETNIYFPTKIIFDKKRSLFYVASGDNRAYLHKDYPVLTSYIATPPRD